jgi:hypothetical protein
MHIIEVRKALFTNTNTVVQRVEVIALLRLQISFICFGRETGQLKMPGEK